VALPPNVDGAAVPEPAPPEAPPVPDIDLQNPDLYINRELAKLSFFERVLAQAQDETVPLLERLRFLTISGQILDEFFEIRVAGLKAQVELGIAETGPDGLSPTEQLVQIREVALRFIRNQYKVLNGHLLPELRNAGVYLLAGWEWSESQRAWAQQYFRENVLPVLTPIVIDPAHPFPVVHNKSLNFIVSLAGKDAYGRRARYAVGQAPRILPRVLHLPPEIVDSPYTYVLLSSIVEEFVEELFLGMDIRGCHPFRLTRNSDLWFDEEAVDDFLHAIRDELSERDTGHPVRLEVSMACPEDITQYLIEHFGLSSRDVYVADGPVNLHRLEAIYSRTDLAAHKYRPFTPRIPAPVQRVGDMFALLRDRDLLLHHPYQSFLPVIDLIEQAAPDPNVLAIKQTVYRIGTNSRLEQALINAAEAGKEVTVVVELRARFDEARNIQLAARLQAAGANVVYGIVGYKTHAKMLLIVRREEGRIRRYVHLGTGNYHEGTTKAYTDFGFLTSRDAYADDVQVLFQQLTGIGKTTKLQVLIQSPFHLRDVLIEHIEREIEHAQRGEPAHIAAKLNSLTEPVIIRALYRASQAGVRIDLVLRSICGLKPGIPGVSENIRVRSIVGRFLEHHRVFYFLAGGERVCLMSSADWMTRNLRSRVEAAFPVAKRRLQKRLYKEAIAAFIDDGVRAWHMQPDGSYERAPAAGKGIDVQELQLEHIALQPRSEEDE
jgi:polyphosphate kinase